MPLCLAREWPSFELCYCLFLFNGTWWRNEICVIIYLYKIFSVGGKIKWGYESKWTELVTAKNLLLSVNEIGSLLCKHFLYTASGGMMMMIDVGTIFGDCNPWIYCLLMRNDCHTLYAYRLLYAIKFRWLYANFTPIRKLLTKSTSLHGWIIETKSKHHNLLSNFWWNWKLWPPIASSSLQGVQYCLNYLHILICLTNKKWNIFVHHVIT